MFRYAVGLFFAGVAIIPFVESEATIDLSANNGQSSVIFVVSNTQGDRCNVQTVVDRDTGKVRVSPQSDCAAINQTLDTARFWRKNADGTIELNDSNGRAIMALVPSNGGDYQSVSPIAPALVFTPSA